MGFTLAECCHPVPGDRIVGLRVKGEGVVVHAIDCLELANGVDADWVDLSWGERSQGAVGRLRVVLYHRLGTLAEMAGIFAAGGYPVEITPLEVGTPLASGAEPDATAAIPRRAAVVLSELQAIVAGFTVPGSTPVAVDEPAKHGGIARRRADEAA